MCDRQSSMIAKVVLASVGFLAVTTAVQAADTNESAAAGIKKTIEKTNALMKSNASLKAFMEVFYEDDLMITGEGEKVFYRSLKSFEKPLAGYLADQTHCKLSVIDPVRSSGDMAAAFIQEHCDPAKPGEKPEDYRILYVFRNGAKGWRVTMEMFTAGVF